MAEEELHSLNITKHHHRNLPNAIGFALRELLSNAFDANLAAGYPNQCPTFERTTNTSQRPTWKISDAGPGIQLEHFIIGFSEGPREKRGRFGMGLKDAIAILMNAGVELIFTSRYGRFQVIERTGGGLKVPTLWIGRTNAPPVTPLHGTQIELINLQLKEVEIEQIKLDFIPWWLSSQAPPQQQQIRVFFENSRGQIFLQPKPSSSPGKKSNKSASRVLFFRGVRIPIKFPLEYSYNLKELSTSNELIPIWSNLDFRVFKKEIIGLWEAALQVPQTWMSVREQLLTIIQDPKAEFAGNDVYGRLIKRMKQDPNRPTLVSKAEISATMMSSKPAGSTLAIPRERFDYLQHNKLYDRLETSKQRCNFRNSQAGEKCQDPSSQRQEELEEEIRKLKNQLVAKDEKIQTLEQQLQAQAKQRKQSLEVRASIPWGGLTDYAQRATPNRQQRKNAKKTVKSVCEVIKSDAFPYTVERIRKGGSAAKYTMIKGHYDSDIVAFLQGFQPTKEYMEEVHKMGKKALTQRYPSIAWHKSTPYALRFRLKGDHVDLLFTGTRPNLVSLSPKDPVGRYYLCSLVDEQVSAFKQRLPTDEAQRQLVISAIHCLKRWKAKRPWTKHAPKSYLLELLCLHVSVTTTRKPLELKFLLHEFFQAIVEPEKLKVCWGFSTQAQPPVLLDIANKDNNLWTSMSETTRNELLLFAHCELQTFPVK